MTRLSDTLIGFAATVVYYGMLLGMLLIFAPFAAMAWCCTYLQGVYLWAKKRSGVPQ